MKYFIGQWVVSRESESLESAVTACIVAPNTTSAQKILNSKLDYWGGMVPRQKRETARGVRALFVSPLGGPIEVETQFLQEISPSTFDELSLRLPVYGEVEKGSLGRQDVQEQSKTLARRIFAQLQKSGKSVSYGRLLDAIAASMGESSWQVLKHKAAPKTAGSKSAESETEFYPEGNLYQGPLRDAKNIEYSARVDAIWLTDGDVTLAARLLRCFPDSLMNSFINAMDADTAFCCRPSNWLPEHSLSRDFGVKANQGHAFDVKVSRGIGSNSNRYQIEGTVDGRTVIQLNNHIDPLHFGVGSSSCFPYDLHAARKVAACYEEAFRQAFELRHADSSAE